VYFAERFREIARVFEYLDAVDGIELAVRIWRTQAKPAQRSRAAEIWSALMSIAETWPVGPTNWAASTA
jgi:hypothetical protein